MVKIDQQSINDSYNRVTATESPRSLKETNDALTAGKLILQGTRDTLISNWDEAIAKRMKAYDHGYSKLLCTISGPFGCAEDLLTDFLPVFRRSKYYRHAAKRAANAINCDEMEQLVADFSKRDSHAGTFAALMDEARDDLRENCTKLYWQIKTDMDKQRVPDSAIKASIYQIYILCKLGCDLYDAHVAVGPTDDPGISDEEMHLFRTALIGIEADPEWKQHMQLYPWAKNYDRQFDVGNMQKVRPTALKYNVGIITRAVCGTWTHDLNGMVPACINAIRNKCTSPVWLDKISMAGLRSIGEFDAEIAKLERLQSVRNGDINLSINLLEAVRYHYQGYSREQLHDALMEPYKDKKYGEEVTNGTLAIIDLMQMLDEHPEEAENYAAIEEAVINGDQSSAETIVKKYNRRKAKEAKKARAQASTAQQSQQPQQPSLAAQEEAPLTTEQLLRARLATRFGKVTSLIKEKKPAAPAEAKKPAPVADPVAAPAAPSVAAPSHAPSSAACTPAPATLTITPPSRRVTRALWHRDEEDYVITEHERGITFDCIARQLHRTPTAVKQRYYTARLARQKEAEQQATSPQLQ